MIVAYRKDGATRFTDNGRFAYGTATSEISIPGALSGNISLMQLSNRNLFLIARRSVRVWHSVLPIAIANAFRYDLVTILR